MKNWTFLASLLTFYLISGCQKGVDKVELSAISVSPSSVSISIDEERQLTATPVPDDVDESELPLRFQSDNPVVASVSANGLVRGVSAGSTHISVSGKLNSKIAKLVSVTVKAAPVPLTSIIVDPESLELIVSQIGQLKAVPTPENATVSSYTWRSNDPQIASVSSNGSVTGKALGTTKITVSANNIETEVPVSIVPSYKNPVLAKSLPDPSVIRAANGYFYLYATEDIRNMPIHKSKDLVNWEYVGTCFTEATRPKWEPGAGIWAADINYINGKYVLYYAYSVWGGEWTCGIGVATSVKPEGPFVHAGPYVGTSNEGMLFRSNGIGIQNSIDPCYVEDGNKSYLVWGSHQGIYCVELTADGLAVKSGAIPVLIAGKPNGEGFEGSQIHKRGNYYYLFASWGTCCNGANSTYKTVVGRATSLFGPYFTKSGGSMSNNQYDVVIQGNSTFVGVGHSSRLVTDDEGSEYVLYHGYRKSDPGAGRLLFLDKIVWNNDFPTVAYNTPSTQAKAPVFR
ncbi:MAG: family 43 glycosylhydrolase [Dysgonamonadaceae bacterium]|jgi:arabinan endo-1,5-alpha-L-arabinosidase|nr:family 43 glycosylhydrolase [Dysgonamonadaceae bacterium]